jgi:hypothetical protein
VHRADVGACLTQPGFHLPDSDLPGVITYTIDLFEPQPSLLHRNDTRPPFQGGCADIVSGDDKGDVGSPRRLVCPSTGRQDQSDTHYHAQ